MSDEVFESVFKGISEFFNPMEIEDRKQYEKKHPTDRIRWGLRSSLGENREYLKLIAHPEYHCPTKPAGFRYKMIIHVLHDIVSSFMVLEVRSYMIYDVFITF